MGELFIISGSSGVGKGTILAKFLERNKNFKFSVSCTTRSPREGEIEGINYFFVSREEFINMINNNEFIEWAEFSGNMYGTRRSYVEELCKNGFNVILEIDTQGALKIKQKMPTVKMVFILPPSIEELENRLRGRHTESEDAIKKRLQATKDEIKNSEFYDFKIINNDVDVALKELEDILINKNL